MASTMMSSASLSLSARRNVGGGVAARKLAQRTMVSGKQSNVVGVRGGRHGAIGGTRAFAPQGKMHAPRGRGVSSRSLSFLGVASNSRAHLECAFVFVPR